MSSTTLTSLNSISPTTLGTICSGLSLANGLSLLLSPQSTFQSLYNIHLENDPFLIYLVQATGAIVIGVGLLTYLTIVTMRDTTTNATMTMARALGISLLPRVGFLLSSFITSRFQTIGATDKTFLSINTTIMSWTMISLVTGMGNPTMAGKVFSCVAALKACFLFFVPIKAADKYFGIDVSGDEIIQQKRKTLCMALGEYLTISASHMLFVAFGLDPIKAAGYSAIIWCALLYRMIFMEKSHVVLGVDIRKQLVILGLAMSYALGFLSLA